MLIIHHSGHDSKERSRGSSSIRAAMDVEFSVTKDDSNFVTLKNTKMKEWEPIQPLCFKFKTIELGLFDEYDFPMNGVILESTDEVVNTKTKRLSDTAQKILTHLKTPFVGVKTPDDVRAFCSQKQYTIPQQVITLEDLRKAVYPLLNVEPNSKRTTLKRGID